MAPFKTADIADDGTFTLEKVAAGKYQVSIGGYPAFVKSVRLGQTADDGPMLIFAAARQAVHSRYP